MSEKHVREVQTPYVVEPKEIKRRETVIIRENDVPVAVMMPYEEYQELLEQVKAEALPRKGSPEFERQREAFKRLLPDLLQLHRGKWVAIVNEKPVVFGADRGEVRDQVREKFGIAPVYIQEVSETPRVYKIPHRKVINHP